MKILKRDGTFEDLSFDKILFRLKKLANDNTLGILKTIDPDLIAQKTVSSIYDGISSSQLDEEAARISIGMIENIEYSRLASRIIISNIQKNTLNSFSAVMQLLYDNKDKTDNHAPIITKEMNDIVQKNKEIIDESIDYSRDYLFDYFGYKTIEKSYLLKIKNKVVERPQHLYMRVAIQVHKDDIPNVIKTYNLISQHYFTFASPTLFNSMSHLNNLSSCFHEDTLISTERRGVVRIADIVVGDYVVTHLGNVKKVVQTHKNLLGNRTLYELKIAKTPVIKVTDNHMLWCISVKDKFKLPKWISVEDLSDGDYVSIPNRQVESNTLCTAKSYHYMRKLAILEKTKIDLPTTFFELDRDTLYNTLKTFTDEKTMSKYITIPSLHRLRNLNIPVPLDREITFNELKQILYYLDGDTEIRKCNRCVFLKYESKTKIEMSPDEYVYTLGVEHDHSYNVGGIVAQNCFLLGTSDSVDGMYKTIADCARISKVGGGIGLHVSNIRAKGSVIRGTNGISDGLIPMLKVYNEVSLHINQCFTPNTWVYSKEGPKQILNVSTDDELITIDGSFKKVNQVIKNYIKKDIVEIETELTSYPITVTKEHDIYVIKKDKNSIVKMEPQFYPVSELEVGDLVGYPIPKYTKNNYTYDYDFCKFYGILITNLINTSKTNNNLCMMFTSTTYNVNLTFIKRYLESKGVTYQNNSHTIHWDNSFNKYLGITNDMLYDKNNNICMHPDFLHLPNDKLKYLVDGVNSNFVHLKNNDILSMQIKYINLRLNTLSDTTVENNGLIWCKITKIQDVYYEGHVYDFNMIDNHNYLTDMGLVHNSGRRKGSFAIYLTPDHPDILEFLDLRKGQGNEQMRARDLFLAMWISDLFMEKVQENGDWYLMCPDECPGLNDVYGDDYKKLYYSYVEKGMYRSKIKAQEIWMKILDSQMETGAPYMLYKDSINKKNNQKNIGIIKSSNLCVEPDTMILTSDGYYTISSLENKRVQVWNGREFTKTVIKKTGTNQSLMTIMFSNGCRITCTPYHKFYNDRGRKIEASNLKIGTQLIKYELPVVTSATILNDAYSIGKEMSLICQVDSTNNEQMTEEILSENVKEIIVPINYNIKSKILWLNGLLHESIGFYNETLNKKAITLHSVYVTFFEKTLLMLQTLSCHPVIINNGTYYSLIINDFDIQTLINHGLIYKNEYICLNDEEFKTYYYPKSENIFVTNIILNDKICDTYCFKETNRGMGIFNGVLTGNCSEITLYSDDKEYAVCFTGDTLVLTKEGYKRIDQCDNESVLSVYSDDTNFNETNEYAQCKLIDNGVKDVYELECMQGNKIKSTSNHLFLTYNDGQYKWKQLKHLSIDDNIIICDHYIFGKFIHKEFTKVKSIIYKGKERVYDLNVPKTHNFIAEGFIVHNCNLASVALPKYVEYDENNKPFFNHQLLFEVAKDIVLPMNNVIDYNYYPTPETKFSNFSHRPVGIGCQGLADVYIKMRYPFESEEAKQLNKEIFETLYFGTLTGSLELSMRDGPYSTFDGSPFSEGKLQFDLWKEHDNIDLSKYISGRWNWDELKEKIKIHGVRNSTLLTCMPTASSAQIMGNSDTMEPIDSCIYKKRVLSGEYIIANKYLVQELTSLGLWNKQMKDLIIANNGSIQNINSIPNDIKALYKTVWEMSMKNIIDQSADRSVFIDMTQSLNLFMQQPNYKKLTSMHFYAWNKKLKTGMYYLRQVSKVTAGKFSVDPELEKKLRETKISSNQQSSPQPPEECEMCSA